MKATKYSGSKTSSVALPWMATGFFSGKREEQGQPRVVELEPVLGRCHEGIGFPSLPEPGEEVVVLERIDVDLGQRCQLRLAQFAVMVGVEPLNGEGGERLVELPDLVNRGDFAGLVEDDLRVGINEDVRVRRCRGDRSDQRDDSRE